MKHEDQARAYAGFFQKHEAGKLFVQQLAELLQSAHVNAENDPDHARDYAQRAKGVRLVVAHIDSVMNMSKVPHREEGVVPTPAPSSGRETN